MKKIINIFILLVVCLLPVMVDARANFEFEKEYLYEVFLYEEDDKYYFLNVGSEDIDSSDSLHVYDSEGNLIEEKSMIIETETMSELYLYKPYYEYLKLTLLYEEDVRLYHKDNMFYIVDYRNELINSLNLDDQSTSDVYFDDDLNYAKNVLDDKYDIFYHFKNLDYRVMGIDEINGYYVVAYRDDDYNYTISVIDDNLNILLNFEYDYYAMRPVVYVYDNLIYLKKDNKSIEIYKLDGTKIQTLNISHELIDEYDNDYSCRYLDYTSIYIMNNKMYLPYVPTSYGCEERFNFDDVKDFAKTVSIPDVFTLEYNLDFDVETVSSSNGEFTYETKEDEDGKSYVELKITPKDGYSVEDIIVTDVNGNRIEVTNNKFYRPLNDVKIEVKYVLGEYLPIPDTFLGKSVSLILIGLILVGLGLYTINYVSSDRKVDV